jgi:6-pyruvoyl-tetrahydropterin synthase
VLTRTRTVYTEFKHSQPGLPSWHSCQHYHGHSTDVIVQIQWPGDEASVEQIGVFETAVRDLDARIRSIHLNEVSTNPNPEAQELAEIAHGILAERLPDDLTDGVTVYVNHALLRIPRRWPPAAPGEPVPLPAGYTPHWQH